MNWKAHWKERSRSVRCSARTLIFKDVPEGRRSPTARKGPPTPPANTNTQPCCGTHRNCLRTSERLRLKFQIKKERMNTKQKYI